MLCVRVPERSECQSGVIKSSYWRRLTRLSVRNRDNVLLDVAKALRAAAAVIWAITI
jgi:hypothetical protein